MRLKTLEISQELREKLRVYNFLTLQLQAIPTGRDPRRFTSSDLFPQVTVHISSSIMQPKGLGGHVQAYHGFNMWLAFSYTDYDDIGEIKARYGSELYEFLADSKEGDNYKLFINGEANSAPTIDYEPPEEEYYRRSQSSIALLKLECAVSQRQMFAL